MKEQYKTQEEMYTNRFTEHHEGWALFNTSSSVSRRSVSQYGPKRDFLKELFDASKKYQPHLRRGKLL